MTPSIETQAAAWLAHVTTYPAHRGDFITWLSEQQQAGRIDWPDVRRWQAAAMPRCRCCGGDAVDDQLCLACYCAGQRATPRPDAELRQPFAERSIDFDAARKYLADYVEVPR